MRKVHSERHCGGTCRPLCQQSPSSMPLSKLLLCATSTGTAPPFDSDALRQNSRNCASPICSAGPSMTKRSNDMS